MAEKTSWSAFLIYRYDCAPDTDMELKLCFTVDAPKRGGGQRKPISSIDSHVCDTFPQACIPNCWEVSGTVFGAFQLRVSMQDVMVTEPARCLWADL